MHEDKKLVPSPQWGRALAADWILNLNGQQNARRGSPHIRQTHKVSDRAAQKSDMFGSPNLAEQMWLFLNAKTLFLINRLGIVHFATSSGFFFSFLFFPFCLNASVRHASSTLSFDPWTPDESCLNSFTL